MFGPSLVRHIGRWDVNGENGLMFDGLAHRFIDFKIIIRHRITCNTRKTRISRDCRTDYPQGITTGTSNSSFMICKRGTQSRLDFFSTSDGIMFQVTLNIIFNADRRKCPLVERYHKPISVICTLKNGACWPLHCPID